MLEFFNFFAENWYILTTFLCALILAVIHIIEFIGYPTKKKREEIKNRLLIFITEAEIELGSKTGKLKLAAAYDYFCEAFPYTKKWISLEKFESLVNEVLPTMREVLENQKDAE